MKDTKAQKYVAYYRVSTDKQGRSGLGLDAQRSAVHRCLGQSGGELIEEYTEEESGKKNNRPELERALAVCRRQRATLILATLDRLARKVYFIAGLMESRVNFVLADMPEATPFEIHIRAAMAEEEGRKISERTKVALAALKARGKRLGSPRIDDLSRANRLQADTFAAYIAPVIAELQKTGHNTIESLRDELNRRRVPTARGGTWHKATVHRLIKRIERMETYMR